MRFRVWIRSYNVEFFIDCVRVFLIGRGLVVGFLAWWFVGFGVCDRLSVLF